MKSRYIKEKSLNILAALLLAIGITCSSRIHFEGWGNNYVSHFGLKALVLLFFTWILFYIGLGYLYKLFDAILNRVSSKSDNTIHIHKLMVISLSVNVIA